MFPLRQIIAFLFYCRALKLQVEAYRHNQTTKVTLYYRIQANIHTFPIAISVWKEHLLYATR